MNKLAQISAGAAVMGIIGAIIAWYMAGRMDAGIIMKIISTLITGAVCYFIAYTISEQ